MSAARQEKRRICLNSQGVNKDTAAEWKVWMEEQGFSRRTVNAKLFALNSFLKYAGKREWQETDFYERPEDIRPELTRREYVRLLKAAKRLRKELLTYVKRENIAHGQIFLGRNRSPMRRSTAWHCVSSISHEAKVDEEKVNPRSLCWMYSSTWEGLEISAQALMEQMYERILDEEQMMAGWED